MQVGHLPSASTFSARERHVAECKLEDGPQSPDRCNDQPEDKTYNRGKRNVPVRAVKRLSAPVPLTPAEREVPPNIGERSKTNAESEGYNSEQSADYERPSIGLPPDGLQERQ
jgi:hypothetical protein